MAVPDGRSVRRRRQLLPAGAPRLGSERAQDMHRVRHGADGDPGTSASDIVHGPDVIVADDGLTSEDVLSLRRRILIAEDDAAVRTSVNQILSAKGYLVMEAEDGHVALAMLRGTPVDVLILDLAMPGLGGVDLLRQIDPPPPVVIILSAFAFRTPQEVESEVGPKVFKILKKPVLPARLISSVAEGIEAFDARKV